MESTSYGRLRATHFWAVLAATLALLGLTASPATAQTAGPLDLSKIDVADLPPALQDEFRATLKMQESLIERPDGSKIVPGEVIVKFKANAGASQRSNSIQSVDADGSRSMRLDDVRVIELDAGASVSEAAAELRDRPDVAWAQANEYIEPLRAIPNDTYMNQLWGLRNTGQTNPGPPSQVGTAGMDINVTPLWDWNTGSENTRVAVIDSGIQARTADYPDVNPDIYPNVNQDFSRNFTPEYFPAGPPVPANWGDGLGHGTHVAGTIAAQGNNSAGVTGVAWDADLIAVRVLDSVGGGTEEWIANGMDYAGDIHADVANVSLGYGEPQPLWKEAMEAHPDTLYIAAAGNGGEDGIGDDNDLLPDYPCEYRLANLLCVSALSSNGTMPEWSNWGFSTVHLGAPGDDILSTMPEYSFIGSLYGHDSLDPPYLRLSGTSMAAPHVVGVAALAFAAKPGATMTQVRNALINTTKPTASLSGKVLTGGRVNATAAVEAAAPPYETQCRLPDGTVYKTTWRAQKNATMDIKNLLKKGPGQPNFTNFVDYWGDVAKMEWWSPDTLSHVFTQSGAWGDPFYTSAFNSWAYAASWGAVDQRTDILATSPYGFLSPRVSFRNNGDGLVRNADSCNTYLGDWRNFPAALFFKRTAILGDSMITQMSKKFLNEPDWRPALDPQSRSSFATMRGEVRGMTAGLRDPALGLNQQQAADVMVITLGTVDADAIGALSTPAARTAALNTFKSNVDGVLADSSTVQCRILTTVHETGWKADGSYSAEQLQARKDVNAKLRAVATASASVDLVDWQALSAGHEATKPSGRYYEVADRDNPNPAGLTVLSNAIITKAQGTCS